LNILWQTEHYPDAVKGGGSVVNTYHIVKNMRTLGCKPVVLARGTDGNGVVREETNGIAIIRCPQPKLPPRLWPLWPRLEPFYVQQILGDIAGPFDAFVCHDPSYGLALKRLYSARPVLCRVGGSVRTHDSVVLPESLSSLIAQWGYKRALLEKFLAKQNDTMDARVWDRCDALVVQSAFMKREIANQYGVVSEKIKVIPSGVDHARYSSPESSSAIAAQLGGLNQENHVITFCGRLVRMKNVSYLLRGFAQMSLRDQCILVVAGEGEERAKLEAEAAELNISRRVRFLGHLEKVDELLGVSDIFVLPSVYEPFANALLEAMAAGIPCLALRSDFHRVKTSSDEVIVDGETGFLVDAADPKSLANRLDCLVAQPIFRKEMGMQAQRRCRRLYNWEVCAEQYLSVIAEISASLDSRQLRRSLK